MAVKPHSVDQYLETGCGRCKKGGTPACKVHSWADELRLLREILNKTNLIEALKWNAPCYTHNSKNILMLSALKECVVVSFFQGALMSDPAGMLEMPGEHSQHMRYFRFSDRKSISSRKNILLDYIEEAIAISSNGKKPSIAKNNSQDYPNELVQIFKTNPEFKQAFSALTPGRQRSYLIHFSSAKQSQTISSRIEKCMTKIFDGKGFNER